jgi:hypothetical protein
MTIMIGRLVSGRDDSLPYYSLAGDSTRELEDAESSVDRLQASDAVREPRLAACRQISLPVPFSGTAESGIM